LSEGERIMTICNACRYCEGYCAVFPAMEQRLRFTPADLNYLANLCHQCAECYYACQYSPPHEFAVNVPKTLAEIRVQSYRDYAWPKWFVLVFAAALFAVLKFIGPAYSRTPGAGNFYRLIPHSIMAASFGAVGLFVAAALAGGFVRCWRDWDQDLAAFSNPRAIGEALSDILRLEYMRSGGRGCTYPDERHSNARWWFHQFTFYGFLLCFASTSTAAFYHYAMHWLAPYGYFSLPVILGTLGGAGLVIGPIGLMILKAKRDRAIESREQSSLDARFTVLLLLTSVTGLVLLALRQTTWMGPLLFVHLGIVLALFVTLPYGKFVHGIYRSAALLRYALERKRAPEYTD